MSKVIVLKPVERPVRRLQPSKSMTDVLFGQLSDKQKESLRARLEVEYGKCVISDKKVDVLMLNDVRRRLKI